MNGTQASPLISYSNPTPSSLSFSLRNNWSLAIQEIHEASSYRDDFKLSTPNLITAFFNYDQVPKEASDRQTLIRLILRSGQNSSPRKDECVYFLKLLTKEIKELNLQKVFTNDAQLECLMTALDGNTSLMHLNLSSNSISANGINLVAKMLKGNHTLKTLDIGNSRIEKHNDEDGYCDAMESLEEALTQNTSLETLKLYNLNLRLLSASGRFYLPLLQKNISIKELDLSGNSYDTPSIYSLAESLKTNSHLEVLNLSCNWIVGSPSATGLPDMLKVNNTLKQLDLSNSMVNDECVAALSDALKQNMTLTKLNLQGTKYSTEKRVELINEINKKTDINAQLGSVIQRIDTVLHPDQTIPNLPPALRLPNEIVKKIFINMSNE